jgi:cytochrome b pre-mRNA-processing protein 3
MLSMHLFATMHRLAQEPGDDPELARLLAERFVSDMDAAFREMGVSDLRVPKRMKTLYGSFACRISAYGLALQEGEPALAAAVARNVFADGDEARHALPLARYLRSAVAALREAALQDLRAGAAPFPAPSPRKHEEPKP